MADGQKIKVALIRGDSLNEWEGKLWSRLDSRFEVTGFCSRKNLYNSSRLSFPVKRLATTTDNRVLSQLSKFTSGVFQKMDGLEQELVDFDIAHTAEISYYFTAQAVRAKKLNPRLKVVATIWDNSFGRFEYNYWPGRPTPPAFWRNKINSIIKESAAGVDLFLPITAYSAALLRDYGVPAEKIRILTPAIIPPAQADAAEILAELKLENREIFMVVNRMVKEKGVYDVLYAWKMYLRQAGSGNQVLLMIGKGPERANLMRLASEWGIDHQVAFVEQLPNDQVRALYGQAKCLILASLPGVLWQEQFGFVLAEAITAGCPVISTYSGAIPEVAGAAGMLFSPGNPVELYECLQKINQADIHDKLKNNCAEVGRKFLVEDFIAGLSGAYLNLLHD